VTDEKAKLELGGCLKGSHPFERLSVLEMLGARGDAVIRWCPMCGTVVVDLERNKKLAKPGGVVRERVPEITRAALGLVRKVKPGE
jgi:hypothetical protein